MIAQVAIAVGTVAYLVAAIGFLFQDHKPYTAAIFMLYGICNILITLGSRG